MRAILINPYDRSVSAVDYNGALEHMYQLIGCDCVDRADLGHSIDIWCDDNGNLKKGASIFRLGENPTMWVGKALLLGHDGAGGSVHCELQIELILLTVQWTEMESSGKFTPGRQFKQGDEMVFEAGRPIPMLRQPDQYLLWSNEHGGWWKGAGVGYTRNITEAGRYPRHRAISVMKNAVFGSKGGVPNEIAIREVDAIAGDLLTVPAPADN